MVGLKVLTIACLIAAAYSNPTFRIGGQGGGGGSLQNAAGGGGSGLVGLASGIVNGAVDTVGNTAGNVLGTAGNIVGGGNQGGTNGELGLGGVFRPLIGGLTELSGNARSLLKDLANFRIPGTVDDVLNALITVAAAIGGIINAVLPGTGSLLANLVIGVLKILICTFGSPGITGAVTGDRRPGYDNPKDVPAICQSGFGSKYGAKDYNGNSNSVHDIYIFYNLGDLDNKFKSAINKKTNGQGVNGLQGSQKLIAQWILQLTNLVSKRQDGNFSQKDINEISILLIKIAGGVGNSYQSGLGDKIASKLVNYLSMSSKGSKVRITINLEGQLPQIKKDIDRCSSDTFGGAIKANQGGNNGARNNQNNGQQTTTNNASNDDNQTINTNTNKNQNNNRQTNNNNSETDEQNNFTNSQINNNNSNQSGYESDNSETNEENNLNNSQTNNNQRDNSDTNTDESGYETNNSNTNEENNNNNSQTSNNQSNNSETNEENNYNNSQTNNNQRDNSDTNTDESGYETNQENIDNNSQTNNNQRDNSDTNTDESGYETNQENIDNNSQTNNNQRDNSDTNTDESGYETNQENIDNNSQTNNNQRDNSDTNTDESGYETNQENIDNNSQTNNNQRDNSDTNTDESGYENNQENIDNNSQTNNNQRDNSETTTNENGDSTQINNSRQDTQNENRQTGSGGNTQVDANGGVNLGAVFRPLIGGLTDLSGNARSRLKDLANFKIPGTADDVVNALLTVGAGLGGVINAVLPGTGNLILKSGIGLLKIVICALGSTGATGDRRPGYDVPAICQSGFASKYGLKAFNGNSNSASDIYNFYDLGDLDAKFRAAINKKTNGQGVKGLQGSQKIIAQWILQITSLIKKRQNGNFSKNDVNELSLLLIKIVGGIGNSYQSGLGDKIVTKLVNYLYKSTKDKKVIVTIYLQAQLPQIKKDIDRCSPNTFGGAIKANQGGNNGARNNRNNEQQTVTDNASNNDSQTNNNQSDNSENNTDGSGYETNNSKTEQNGEYNQINNNRQDTQNQYEENDSDTSENGSTGNTDQQYNDNRDYQGNNENTDRSGSNTRRTSGSNSNYNNASESGSEQNAEDNSQNGAQSDQQDSQFINQDGSNCSSDKRSRSQNISNNNTSKKTGSTTYENNISGGSQSQFETTGDFSSEEQQYQY